MNTAGAPAYNESAIFIVRSGAFSGAYPWKLVMLGNRVDRATGTRSFASFESKYWLPAWSLQGGRPVVQEPPPAWLKVWKAKATEIRAERASRLRSGGEARASKPSRPGEPGGGGRPRTAGGRA